VKLYRFGSNRRRSSEEEFKGTGGLYGAGRWHRRGRPVVYTSTVEPLSLLEKLVHRKIGTESPVYPLYMADIPDNLIEELPASSLPADWRSIYPAQSTQILGDIWLSEKRKVGLLVPSVLLHGTDPRVKNCLLNPEHPQYPQMSHSGPMLLPLDWRFDGPR
jgi:RES domain-containing protein